MNAWTSANLEGTFSKRIAGFDVRETPKSLEIHKPGIAVARLIRIGDVEWRPATLDSGVWPRFVTEDQERACNGVNLFPTFALASRAVAREGGVIVAFEFPSSLIDELAETFGLPREGQAPEFEQLGRKWTLLGYDVVDIRTQSSALYSFDWSLQELTELVAAPNFGLNQYGLLEESQAMKHCASFDRRIPEHAPFAPCAVWMDACRMG